MALIIELPGRASGNEFQKFPADKITIGRALDNDLILTDPHVDAHHAVLETSESGETILRDLGSLNGSIVKKLKCGADGCNVSSGDEIILGKTRLRLYTPTHVVPDSIQLTWVEKLAQLAGNPLITAGFCLILMALTLYTQYARELTKFYIGREILTAIGVLLVFALWPAGWSLFARYKKHEARFLAQLSATICFAVLVSMLEKINNWLAFHNGTNIVVDGFMIILTTVLALLLIWFHYYLSIFLSSKKRWLYSATMTGLFASIIYIGSTIDNGFSGRPDYTASVYPPSISFYTTESSNEFLAKADQIFEKASEQTVVDDN